MRLFARGVVFMSEWRKNEKRIDPGALNGKHTGFALKCELSNEKMQKTAAPGKCLDVRHDHHLRLADVAVLYTAKVHGPAKYTAKVHGPGRVLRRSTRTRKGTKTCL